MTEPASPWWQLALITEPLRWTDGRAYFVEPDKDIPVDHAGGADRRRWSRMRHHHFNWLEKKLAELPDGSRLIDLGAGPVQFQELTGRFSVCHVDHYPYQPIDIVTDITRPIPLKDGCTDSLMLSNVLEHVYEPRRLLRECCRLMRPGGTLFMVVPFMIKEHQAPHDYFRYTRYALEKLGVEAGFSSVTIDPLGNLFDIYDVDRWVRAQKIRARTSGVRHLAARGLIKIQNLSESLLRRTLSQALANEVDDIGFPQSFGMLARKDDA